MIQICSYQMMPMMLMWAQVPLNLPQQLHRIRYAKFNWTRASCKPPAEASLAQRRGRGEGDRGAQELYECQKNPKKCQDLHPDAQLLDRQLFQPLQTIIKGSLRFVISHLFGQCACYTFGIIAIWRHHRLSSAIRKRSAMTRMQELQCHGDAGKWQLDYTPTHIPMHVPISTSPCPTMFTPLSLHGPVVGPCTLHCHVSLIPYTCARTMSCPCHHCHSLAQSHRACATFDYPPSLSHTCSQL